MSLWQYEPEMMDALIDFIVSLAASSGKYLDLCLSMLTSHFEMPLFFADKLKMQYGLAKKDQVLTRVHTALKDIADLVPLSPVRTVIMVSERLESFRKNNKTNTKALGEFVRVSMLMKLVDLLLHLDVEVGSWDKVLQDNGIFQMELDDMDDFTDDFMNKGIEHSRNATSNDVTLKSFAEMLDSLMLLTFERLESCEGGGRLNEVFKTLLKTFRNKV